MLFILINVKQNDEMAMFQRELDTMSAKEILDFIENKNMIMSKSVIVFMNALNWEMKKFCFKNINRHFKSL